MLIISVSDLPSKGLGYLTPSIEINPMTLKEIEEYESYPNSLYIEKLYRDTNFLLRNIKNKDEINLYDLQALIFTKKYVSSVGKKDSIKFNYRCTSCDKPTDYEQKLSEIDFVDLGSELLKIKYIKVGSSELKFEIPKYREIIKSLEILLKYKESLSKRTIYLLLLLGFHKDPNTIKAAISNAILDEILLLNHIYKIFSGSTHPISIKCECGEVSTLDLDDLIVDIFRILLINNQMDEKKIITEERV